MWRLVLMFAFPLLTQPTIRLSLKQPTELAFHQNPAIAAARHDLEAADARIKQARADYFPQVGFGGIAKAGPSGATNALGLVGLPNSPFYRNFADSLNVYQSALDFGRRKYRVAAERKQREALEADLAAAEAIVVLQTQRAYYNVLRTLRLRDVASEVVRSREAAVRQAQIFYEAQVRSRVDLELARSALARARLRLLETENSVRSSMAELGRALGSPQDANCVLEEPDPALPQLEPVNALIEEAYGRRPELIRARALREAAGQRLELAKSQKRPLFALAFSGGYARFRETLALELLAGGVGLLQPLFTGARLQGQVEEAEAVLRATASQEEVSKQGVALEVRNAWMRLENSLEALPVLRSHAESSRQALRLASERYRERLGAIVELNEAQASLSEAAAGEAAGLYDVKIAEAELGFAIGRVRGLLESRCDVREGVVPEEPVCGELPIPREAKAQAPRAKRPQISALSRALPALDQARRGPDAVPITATSGGAAILRPGTNFAKTGVTGPRRENAFSVRRTQKSGSRATRQTSFTTDRPRRQPIRTKPSRSPVTPRPGDGRFSFLDAVLQAFEIRKPGHKCKIRPSAILGIVASVRPSQAVFPGQTRHCAARH